VNQFIIDRPQLYSCEVLIEARHHSFLRRDSYIDCREAFILADYELKDRRGSLNETTRRAVLAAVSACPVLRRRYKEMILA
jgi:hypothetical protein